MAEISDHIIDATMALIAERPFADVTVLAIAREAGVSLAELNQQFATRADILEAFSRRIDRTVLAGDFSDMADENPRDRLFDVLMTRLDALRPYRGALRSLMRSARRDPQLAFALNAIAMNSQAWMLAAAGLSVRGLRGRMAVQSLVVAFAKVLRVFVAEEDPGMPRTMAALDQELKTLEERHNRLSRLFGYAISPEPPSVEPETGWASAQSAAAGGATTAFGEMPEAGEAEAAAATAEAVDGGRSAGSKAKAAGAASARATSSSGSRARKPRPSQRRPRASAPDNDEPETL